MVNTTRPGSLSLFAALILIATAAGAADGMRGLDSLFDFLQTDTLVAEAAEIIKEGPQTTLTEIRNTTSSNDSSTTPVDCPFNAEECCVQNNTNATKACVSSLCATIVSPSQESNSTCTNLVNALLAMYASKSVPKGGAQMSAPIAGSGIGSVSGTTNMPTADPTTEPTDVPTADPTTEPTDVPSANPTSEAEAVERHVDFELGDVDVTDQQLGDYKKMLSDQYDGSE